MKKLMLSLIFGIMLIGMGGFVVAENCTEDETKSYTCPDGTEVSWCECENNQFVCIISPENKCENWCYEDETKSYTCPDGTEVSWCGCENNQFVCIISPENACSNEDENETKEKNETDNNNNNQQNGNGLGQIIRGRVKAGIYTSPEGQQIRVRTLAQNRLRLTVGNCSVDCDCDQLNLTQEQVQNRTKLKATLSNGRNAEVKIMPDVASATALARLRLKQCDESRNCSIELKEVGQGEKARLVYEARARKTFRIFGFIKNRAEVRTQIDAETGEEIASKRPWWAWLASESEE